MFLKSLFTVISVLSLIIMGALYFLLNWPGQPANEVHTTQKQRSGLPSHLPLPGSCTYPAGSVLLKDHFPSQQYEEPSQRQAKECQQQKARTSSPQSRLLYALPNSPLQYPIQGYTVQPLTSTLIPGLGLHAGERRSYKVFLHVSKGILNTATPPVEATVTGAGETGLIIESSNLLILNYLLAKVSYTSTVDINTGDLASFQFENHVAVFPIAIKQPQLAVLYDIGTDINSQVTIITKTSPHHKKFKVLLDSIRKFYSKIKVIVADESSKKEHITGENIERYILPPGQGSSAGRNLALSQVTTKYFLWLDDDFEFTEQTKIEKLVEVMEAVPELDVVGGSVQGNRLDFSPDCEEGEETEGSCLYRRLGGKFSTLPGYPQCNLASGVANFFLGLTEAVWRVGFDSKLLRPAQSEFLVDGLGSLMVATCDDVIIGHQPKNAST